MDTEKTKIDLKMFTGWLTRDGELIECDVYDHSWAAEQAGQAKPYGAGWVHYWEGEPDPTNDRTVTAKQMDMVLAIAAASGLKLDIWFQDMRMYEMMTESRTFTNG